MRIILATGQRDIYDDQLGEAVTEDGEIVAEGSDLFFEELEILSDAHRMLRRKFLLAYDGVQGVAVGLGKEQLVGSVTFL